MDDKNFINNQINQIGDGENESPIIPKSPEPKIDLRTLESDLKDIKENGGQNVSGYQPQLNQTQTNQDLIQTPQPEQNINQAQTPNDNQTNNLTTSPNKIQKNKTGLIITIIGLIIIFILIGYFIIYPKISSTQQKNLNNQNNLQQDLIKNSLPPQIEINPINQIPTNNLPPENLSQSQNEKTQNQTKISTLNLNTIENYKSFSKKPNIINEIILPFLNLEYFKVALPKEDLSTPTIKEIIIKNENNQILNLKQILSLMIPDFFNENILNYFDNNLNVFKYINNKGNWLIFVLKLKEKISPEEFNTLINQMVNLQKSQNLINLFLENPGQINVWQDGKIKNKPTSLVNFEKEGATLSYTWFNQYLLLSTNLEGAEKIADNLDY